MFPNCMAATALIVTALVGLILSPAQSSDVPQGQTIAELIASLGLDTPGDPGFTPLPKNSTTDTKRGVPSFIDGIDPKDKRRTSSFLDKEQIAAYNDSNGGYAIHLPGGLCVDTVVGDLEAPNGGFVANATLKAVLLAMYHVPNWRLNQYLQNRVSSLQRRMNETLTEVICEPPVGATRSLAFRFDRATHEGFWGAYLIGGAGVLGIGFGGLHAAIAGYNAGRVNETEQVWILTATGVCQYIWATAVFRLQTRGWIGPVEAFVLNLFIIVAEYIWLAVKYLWATTCAVPSAFRGGLSSLAQVTVGNMQGFNPRAMTTGGESAVDLVGQDIEQGRQSIPPGQACA